ncbi:MAG: hypothetical protein QOG15_913 [Solirubrobacteraceae bacterium]|jgi:hypothetical protein|nr:hypothetical protein [Solirubrobacteraceae bacterium]
MTPLALSTTGEVLAIIGLAVGLVVFGVVVWLLNGVLTPLRRVLADVRDAETAPLLKNGVKGVDQLGRTRQLASGVPDLAVAYMTKLGLPVNTEPAGEVFPERGSTSGLGGFR